DVGARRRRREGARPRRPRRPARAAGGVELNVVSDPRFATLHPTGMHPESQARIEVLHERFAFDECAPAAEEDVLRCHSAALIERVRTSRGWLDADTACTETSFD